MMERRRSLLIDDGEITLMVVASTLGQAGYDVRTASDLDALATAFGAWKPDLILTDAG